MLSASRYSLFGLLATASFALCQTPAPTPTPAPTAQATSAQPVAEPMPTDPAALLALAAKKNGLQNAGTDPLHIKASFELLDDRGAVKEKGSFEEYWVSPKKYKLIYSSPSFNQTDFSTVTGLFRVGDPKWPDDPVAAVHSSLFPDIPSVEMANAGKLKMTNRSVGSAKLKCVTVESDKPGALGETAAFCFEFSSPALRFIETFRGISQTLYTGVTTVSGIYVGRDVTYFSLGKLQMRMHLESLETTPHVNESDMMPPAGATKITMRISVGSAVMNRRVVSKVRPAYPEPAKAARVQGTVVLRAVIGTDGRIVEAGVISGPSMLQAASLDAVRQWVYQPYIVDGEPVEVETEINVVFSLN